MEKKKEEKIFRDIVKILEQDVPQEALAEGNPTPEQEAIALIKQELDKAREEGRREGSKKLYRSISKELYKLYSDIECLGDLRDGVYDLSDKYEKLSKLKDNK